MMSENNSEAKLGKEELLEKIAEWEHRLLWTARGEQAVEQLKEIVEMYFSIDKEVLEEYSILKALGVEVADKGGFVEDV
jgi:hypothetical protein